MAKKRTSDSRKDPVLVIIAIYKLLTAVAIAAGAIGLTRLFHKNVEANAEHWLDMVSIDPDNRYVGGLLNHLHMVHTKELKGLAALGLFFSALFLTEGTGLLLRQHWAAWLTVVATALFLPLEIYKIITNISAGTIVLFAVNAAIVGALVYRIRSR